MSLHHKNPSPSQPSSRDYPVDVVRALAAELVEAADVLDRITSQ